MKQRDKVLEMVKKLRNKLWMERILKYFLNTLLASAAGILALTITAHMFPILCVPEKCVWTGAVLVFGGLSAGLLRRPGIKAAAQAGDSLGLNNRLSTYLETADREGPVMDAFREEAKEAVESFNPAVRYRLIIQWKRLLAAFVLMILSIGIFFIPSPKIQVAAEKQSINEDLKAEAKSLEQLRLQAQQENEKQEKEEDSRQLGSLSDLLLKLEKKLTGSYSYEQAALNVSKTQKELEALGKNPSGEDMKGLAGIFDGMDKSYDRVKQFLESGEPEQAALVARTQSFTHEEQDKMLENINRLQSAMKEGSSSMLKETLEKLKAAAEKGNLDGNQLADALKKASDGKQALKLAEETGARLQSLKERLMAKGENGFKSFGDGQKSSMFTEGENGGMKNGESGEGNSSEIALGEAGNMAARNPNGIGGGIVSDGSGKDVKSRDGQVDKSGTSAVPDLTGVHTSDVKGIWQDGQGTVKDKESDKVVETDGEIKDVDTLYKEFQREGMEYVFKYEIPSGEKQLVVDYFNRLNGGQ